MIGSQTNIFELVAIETYRSTSRHLANRFQPFIYQFSGMSHIENRDRFFQKILFSQKFLILFMIIICHNEPSGLWNE